MADKECPNCGGVPMGSGCYHICRNSDSFYSPEQERADDVHYGEDDMSERYAATVEPSQYADHDPDDGPDYGYGEACAIADSGDDIDEEIPF